MASGNELEIALRIKADLDQARTQLKQLQAQIDQVGATAAKASGGTQAQAAAINEEGKAAQTATATLGEHATAVTALGETEEQRTARIHAMVQASMRQVEADRAATASALKLAAAQTTATESTAANAAAVKAFQQAWFGRTAVAAADASALDGILAGNVKSVEQLAAAEALLDKMQKNGTISTAELNAAFAALNKVTESNIVANKSAALSSRAQSEIATAASEVLSGNFGRLRRTGAAFANQAGLLSKLMTPMGLAITAAAAAVAVLSEAFLKGEKEADAFNRALVSTGNTSTASAAQLVDMASRIGAASGHYGDAVTALTSLANTGRYTRAQLGQLTQTAVDFATMTGGKVADGVKFVDGVMSGHLDTLIKLDQQYHFLSAAQLDQIQRLQAQGDQEHATAIAQTAASDAAHARAQEVQDSAGILIKAGESVASTWTAAWNAIKDVGATHSFADQLAEAQASLQALQDQSYRPEQEGKRQAQMVAISAQIEVLKQRVVAQAYAQTNGGSYLGEDGEQHTVQGAVEQNADTKSKAAGTYLAQFKTPAEALLDAQKKAEKELHDYLLGHHSDADIDAAYAHNQVELDRAQKQFDSATKQRTPKDEAAKRAASALASFQQYTQGLDGSSLTVENDSALSKYVQATAKLTQEFDKAVAKGANVSAATKAFWAGSAANAKKYEDAVARSNAQVQAFVANLQAQLATQQQVYDLDVAAVGMGDKEASQARQLLQLKQQYYAAVAQLDREHADKSRGMTDDQYAREKDALQQHFDAEVAQTQQHYRQMDQAQADWKNGMVAAMANWADAGNNVAGQVQGVFSDAFGGMNDALVNFVTTGKLNFTDLSNSIIADLTRMALHIAESQILTSILGSMMGSGTDIGASYMAGGGSSYAASGVNWGVGSLGGYADGGISYGKQVALVSEGRYPAEAHVPLPDGKSIPVTLNGALSGGAGDMQVVVNITNQGQPVQAQQTGQRRDGNQMIVDMIITAVSGDISAGGKSAKAMQQRFGLQRRGVPVGS